MQGKTLGNEIKNGMNVMGGDFKLAGKVRTAQLVLKQGYVSFVNQQAVEAFRADPDYIDWNCTCVNGEYRFYPPEDKKKELIELVNKFNKGEVKNTPVTQKQESPIDDDALIDVWDTKQIVETYKREIADLSQTTFVSITVLKENPEMCQYRLFSINKASGERKIVQDFTTKFDGKFVIELIPSIYNQLMGGLPVIDDEKGNKDQRTISFQSVEGGRCMVLSNLNDSQLYLIKSMKEYVDNQYFNLNGQIEKGTKKL